jgi:hypothetical protein
VCGFGDDGVVDGFVGDGGGVLSHDCYDDWGI